MIVLSRTALRRCAQLTGIRELENCLVGYIIKLGEQRPEPSYGACFFEQDVVRGVVQYQCYLATDVDGTPKDYPDTWTPIGNLLYDDALAQVITLFGGVLPGLVKIARGGTVDRDNVPKEDGLLYYDRDKKQLSIFDRTDWVDL